MPFERIRGRIDAEGVVVDGQLLTWDKFLQLLQPYEGWEFDLRIPLNRTGRRAGIRGSPGATIIVEVDAE